MHPQRQSNRDSLPAVMYFLSGMAVALMGYSVYSHLKTLHDRNKTPYKNSNKQGAKLEDSIRLKSLAYLTQSHNVNIQSSSIKIILERAMSAHYLPKIIDACDKHQPIDIRSKALPSLQLLTRKENNKTALLEAGALGVLVDALKCTDPDMKEVTQRYVAVAICDLIQGSDINKQCILELGVLEPIKRILSSEEIRNNELKYWTLMILYQISLSDPLPRVLIDHGFVSLLAKMARMTYGNTNMPKFCLQSLVRITANVDVTEAKKILTELLSYNIVDLIFNCLRGDDVELIYWAAGLMHEFVLKDVAADKFREIKGIHTILSSLLSAEEMYISRVVLRIIKFMAFGQDKFRTEMVRTGIVKKIMHCLSLDDEDVRYWAVLCIHVVAGQVESHQDIISAPEFEILLELALSTKIKVAIFISDILSLVCCISSNHTLMEPNLHAIAKTLNDLLTEGELDVQYNAAGAIFNVMTMTYAFSCKIRDVCFKNLIQQTVSASHERVQLTCAKGTLELAIKNQLLLPQVNHQVIEPLIQILDTICKSFLPVIITQALIKANKSKETENPTRSLITDIDDEEFPRTPDYVDVTEQGTISNASRLDRVLENKGHTHHSADTNSSWTDMAYLFDTAIPISQRESLLAAFELPLSARNQLVGALSALNILIENDQIISYLVTGESYPTLTEEYKKAYLPPSVRHLIQHLIRLSLYPVLDTWAHLFYAHYPVHELDGTKANELYHALIQWIRTHVELSPSSHLSTDHSDTSGEENGFISIHYKKTHRHKYTRHNNNNNKNSSGSSNSSTDSEIEDNPVLSAYPLPSRKRVETTAERLGDNRKRGFANRALTVLNSISRYATIRQYLIQEVPLLSILAYLYEDHSSLTDRVMVCLGTLFASDPFHVAIHESNFQRLAILLWRGMKAPLANKKKSYVFYSRLVLVYCSHYIGNVYHTCKKQVHHNHPAFVELDLLSKSKYCLVNYENRRQVRNESWTFETIRATHGIPPVVETNETHKYAYEVVLESSGLMQVGWVTEHFEFDPEGGQGVGDDIYSYGYDGDRSKKWHGRFTSVKTSYGLKWAEGDVITCAIDLDAGEIRYYKNGHDMGVAFSGVMSSRSWYPAISLATGQQCKFQFGGSMDPLSYLPKDYMPVGQLALQSPVNMKLPPPHFVKLDTMTESDEHDIVDLTKALEKMTFHSEDVGNMEPNIRPVDGGGFMDYVPKTSFSLSSYIDKAHTLSVEMVDTYKKPLPSVYFEFTLGFFQHHEDVFTNTHSLIAFGLKSLNPAIVFYFEYDKQEHTCYFVLEHAHSNSFDFVIQDGDTVGMLYIHKTNEVGLTLNGSIQALVYLGNHTIFTPYVPFTTGAIKYEINYGEDPYLWKHANSAEAKQCHYQYLCRLLDK
ncbi:uncharacterized protein B0P05DRAFT_535605 [Gilbertella persicaria]|uniref:uncharacterized protein n=1 Tax=Gilbertella persicaria TaxID=101096 RepID=UPI00221F7458|nr:uncharacterized protein B0P05DRAFT_535605 [Gilbertella persicaria]KAI8083959.1 hypothetical protein B0P05DRAFT_535605 [Gilbertella persicaria]